MDATMSGVPRLICPLSFIGSPPGADFDNSFGWSIGAVYAVAPPFSVFAFLDGSTAIAAGQDDPLELRVGAEFRLIKALKLRAGEPREASRRREMTAMEGTRGVAPRHGLTRRRSNEAHNFSLQRTGARVARLGR